MRPSFIFLTAIVGIAVVAGSVFKIWWLAIVTALAAGYVYAITRKSKS